jgi:SET domain-containing protein
MPQLFKTEIKYSPISGRGIFAAEDIPKGAIWWTFNDNGKSVPCMNSSNLPNQVLRKEEVRDFVHGKTHEELVSILDYSMYYPGGDIIVVLRDGAGVVNHSFEPNSQIVYNEENSAEKLCSMALRDIKAGEEIVENYGNYLKHSNNWSEDLFKKYVPSRLEFEAAFDIKKVTA